VNRVASGHQQRCAWCASTSRWIPTPEIADELGRTVLAVCQMAMKMGVRKDEEAFADACRWKSPREAMT